MAKRKQTNGKKRVANDSRQDPRTKPTAEPTAEPTETTDEERETFDNGVDLSGLDNEEEQLRRFLKGAIQLQVKRLAKTSTKRAPEFVLLDWEWDPATFSVDELRRPWGGGSYAIEVRRADGQFDRFGLRIAGPPRDPDPATTPSQRHTGMPSGMRLAETPGQGWVAIIGQSPEDAYRNFRDQVFQQALREQNHKMFVAMLGLVEKLMTNDPTNHLMQVLGLYKGTMSEALDDKKKLAKDLERLRDEIASGKGNKADWKDILTAIVGPDGVLDKVAEQVMKAKAFMDNEAEAAKAKLLAGSSPSNGAG